MARPRDTRIDDGLIAAWHALAAEQAYDDITMEAIAARAGVGKPALYRRFPNKAQLAFVATVSDSAPPGVPDRGDVRAELLECVDRLVASCEELPRAVFADQVAAMILDAEFADRVQELHAPADAAVVRVLQRAVDRGEVRADVGDLRRAVWDLGAPAIFAVMVRHLDADAEYRARLVDRFLDGVRG